MKKVISFVENSVEKLTNQFKNTETKRKVGRPRKIPINNQTSEIVEKRKRGRPRKERLVNNGTTAEKIPVKIDSRTIVYFFPNETKKIQKYIKMFQNKKNNLGKKILNSDDLLLT